eukprot:CAMPEP_0116869746 /NCGR_PEP_ID=MMETSP0418-20121206/27927_1 /TAXON_ID=1158023 /ORGANISM="Astrosyne radiata, Strain 13vi08-1A" /LENGTH=193 /DNA_ID=CAMNT_0004505869 /DNA_START=286 /DNA_END=867 /DNA_ORIENTATION=+
MALHPDRTEGDEFKADAFKEASEAYNTLSDSRKRTEYDSDFLYKSHAAQHNPNYRKVYAPRPPPDFKIFDFQRHYEMHYGDGQMREEVSRARKRAKEAAGREEYRSPLGKGFVFKKDAFSSSQRRTKTAAEDDEYDYTEAHFFDSNSSDMSTAKRVVYAKQTIQSRMEERRTQRKPRPRDSPSPPDDGGCVVM